MAYFLAEFTQLELPPDIFWHASPSTAITWTHMEVLGQQCTGNPHTQTIIRLFISHHLLKQQKINAEKYFPTSDRFYMEEDIVAETYILPQFETILQHKTNLNDRKCIEWKVIKYCRKRCCTALKMSLEKMTWNYSGTLMRYSIPLVKSHLNCL